MCLRTVTKPSCWSPFNFCRNRILESYFEVIYLHSFIWIVYIILISVNWWYVCMKYDLTCWYLFRGFPLLKTQDIPNQLQVCIYHTCNIQRYRGLEQKRWRAVFCAIFLIYLSVCLWFLEIWSCCVVQAGLSSQWSSCSSVPNAGIAEELLYPHSLSFLKLVRTFQKTLPAEVTLSKTSPGAVSQCSGVDTWILHMV